MKLHFVRHGESEANTRHIISNRESPFGLTAIGKAQARALAENLRDVPFSAIFCSPVLRARETADILSTFFEISYQATEALREYDCGILEEQGDQDSWNAHRYYFDDWMLNGNYQNKPEGGECFLDIQDRFIPFMESLKNDPSYKDKHILLVSHGGLFLLMLSVILKNIDFDFLRSHGIGHTECIIAELISSELVCKQ
jgi:probable phosphoglycerate mutase